MKQNILGRTGLKVSALGFGTGFVGGLMVQGSAADQDRAIGLCGDLGITYFDTAPHYGRGRSEENLGRALAQSSIQAIVGTKVMVPTATGGDISGAVRSSVEESLRRLRTEQISLLQVHNGVAGAPTGNGLKPEVVLDEVVPVLRSLQSEGKVRFIGMSGLGETDAIKTLVASDVFDTVQLVINLLNATTIEPSQGTGSVQDYLGLHGMAAANHAGTIGIRILAGGALSGASDRHPVALQKVDPIGSGTSYSEDVETARSFLNLVDEGHAKDLVDLAIRYALSFPFSTSVIGFSDVEQLRNAAASAERGPLNRDTLTRIAAIQTRARSKADDARVLS
jgi:aryl-alcohol dehydrogenase-like predicted oxidoreductase